MKPYFCENCCARYDQAGDCKTCPEEALLDLRDEDVIEMLEGFDDRRYRKKAGMFTVGLAFILLPVLFYAFYIDMKWPIFIYGMGIVSGTAFLVKTFPPAKKCPPESDRNFVMS